MLRVVLRQIDSVKELVRRLEEKADSMICVQSSKDTQPLWTDLQQEKNISAYHAIYLRLRSIEESLNRLECKVDTMCQHKHQNMD
jgi:tetrahydromethanopterin S-methyltransferase subunit B